MRHTRTIVLIAALACACIAPAPWANAAFPGANGRIAFSTDFGRRPQIFTVLPDGTGLLQLTHVPKGHAASSPEWSPDGTRIVFTLDTGIWVMNADGSDQHRLTPDTDPLDQTPSWSPDGTRIVFSRCFFPFGEQHCSISVMNADGTGLTRLLGGRSTSSSPEYSPDGETIAFVSDRNGYVSNVWVMNGDGTGLERLTDPKLQAWAPDWSPDGRHIVFTSDAALPFSSVWVMRANGRRLHELTHLSDGHQAAVARYSPDGTKITLVSDLALLEHWDLYVMNANGSNLHAIVTDQPTVFATDWGPAATP